MDGDWINRKQIQELLQFLNHMQATNDMSLGIIFVGVDDNGKSSCFRE